MFLIIKFGKKISILNINRNIKQHFQLLLIFYLLKKLIYKLKLLKKYEIYNIIYLLLVLKQNITKKIDR